MDRYAKPEPWMLGYLCEHCDEEIWLEQAVVVIDIDHSDARGGPVAKVAHATCDDQSKAVA